MEILKKNYGIILAVVLALIASLSIYFTIKALSPSIPVVVANQYLKVGTVITKDVLTTTNFSTNNVPPTAYTYPQDVIGKTVVNGPIVAGDVIRSEHLSLEGSLMAVLKTYAPEGWTAVELPEGYGDGLKGLKKGDQVNIYGETTTLEGTVVSELVKNAIILSIPDSEARVSQYVIAVPNKYAFTIAEVMVRNKAVAITLPAEAEDIENIVENVPENTSMPEEGDDE